MGSKVQHLPEYEPIPKYLRELREKAGLTQRAIGQLLDKPQSYVQYCETGSRRVDLAEFVQWTEACGVDAVEAFQGYLKLIQ